MRKHLAAAVLVAVGLVGVGLVAANDDSDHGVTAGVDLPEAVDDVVGAKPAAAHHTHSPSALCRYLKPSWATYLSAFTEWYSASGHPIVAHCNYRNNSTFGLFCTHKRYDTHGTYNACYL